MDVWEKNSKRLRRQAQFRQLDEKLSKFHDEHLFLFNLATAGIAIVITLIAFGIVALLDRISQ